MTDGFAPFLARVAEGIPLTAEEMARAMGHLLQGQVEPAAAGAFLVALKVRGETPEEIIGAARAMRAAATSFQGPEDAVDTCGTGGDGANTFNISTATAIVLSACGVPVAKHGNRAVSSQSGSSDVLTALGVDVTIPPAQAKAALRDLGLAFLFAPNHHPAMRHVAPVRKALGVRTLFNMLGPLTNPAGAKRQLLGVYDTSLLTPIAEALRDLGSTKAWVVHGSDGLDELTVTGISHVAALEDGEITHLTVEPEQAGLDRHPPEALTGGDATDNARALTRLLEGEPGAYRDAVILNTAAGLVIAGRTASLNEGARLAEVEIDSGKAKALLDRFVTFTQEGRTE
ncbi:anthranilate phosphoribosyltransferase [Parvularcula bermudensis HTCC2503]|uniref:Anthranilate phosphoribosyltransferase n=1 Tax=Parvularcula bermudensis (strain ATCC BAA-594 / HTCC2503 / KCTC 12087) TaxID=314260 RepID=E0TGT2_PARBH|nr:anthranilate phosphoribosyltransferase [Parvularcula bermudensis]ADM10691.1 anthranilate phosphoribosyltransferase [Parvularcula bermudensis HTCC2503]